MNRIALDDDQPLCSSPRASRETYLALYEEARRSRYPEIDAFEAKCGAAIDRAFLDELALHTQVVVKTSPLSWAHGRVLYSALSAYLRRTPARDAADRVTIVESGTARGFSAVCMAKALADVGRAGTVLTFDILPHDRAIYWNCIDDCDGRKTRAELLAPWRDLVARSIVFHHGETQWLLPHVRTERVHFAFLDAVHDYDSVMFEFGQVAPRQQPDDMIVFDDVTPAQFPGVVQAVAEICTRRGYAGTEIAASADRRYVIARKT